jgi:hypothetical protein
MDSLQNYDKPKDENQQNDRPFLEMVSPAKTEKQVEKVQPKTVAPPPLPAPKRKAPTVREVKPEEEPIMEEG